MVLIGVARLMYSLLCYRLVSTTTDGADQYAADVTTGKVVDV